MLTDTIVECRKGCRVVALRYANGQDSLTICGIINLMVPMEV